jgi:FkbM family methyltransferase
MAILRAIVRGVTRWYPLYSGATGISHLRPLVHWTRHDEVVVTTLRDGTRLKVKLNDFIGRTIYYVGDYDRKITWLCRQFLRPGDCMLDIGANMGVVAAYAARRVGPAGVVHAFEPQPNLAAWLKESAALNGFKHLHVHQIALSDRDGSLPFYVASSTSATASLDDAAAPGKQAITVRVCHTGSYLAELNLPAIRLLKLDVENHELAVLSGARAFFEKNPPEVIAFESHPQGVPAFLERPLVRLLREMDYRLFQIPKAFFRMYLKDVSDGAVDRGFDFVAIHPRSDALKRLA